MEKCFYCNKPAEQPFRYAIGKDKEEYAFCCEHCAKQAADFMNYAERTLPFFWVGIIASMALVFINVFQTVLTKSKSLTILWLGFALMGATILVFPFGTPEIFQAQGIKKAVLTVRVIGMVCLVAGGILAFVMH